MSNVTYTTVKIDCSKGIGNSVFTIEKRMSWDNIFRRFLDSITSLQILILTNNWICA